VSTTGTTVFFLAGICNSEPTHWQSLWRARVSRSIWVEHADWEHPRRDAWLADFDAAWSGERGRKVVVAHSLGCLLFAEWYTTRRESAPALLVAVPDVESAAFPGEASGFRSAFELQVPRGCRMVTSRDDPYASYGYACELAQHWGTALTDVGVKGHINACSCLGEWEEGWALLQALVTQA
jgi:predicted alpha/beta hydrolase family esterase